MRNPTWMAGIAGLSILAAVLPAQALDFDGHWRGQGSTINGDCLGFEIAVSVQDQKIVGRAFQGENDFRITGRVSSEGQLRGEVTYFWVTMAELTGDLVSGRGVGTWSTSKGPACTGKFEVLQVPDGAEPQLANRPDRRWIEQIASD